ncbi:MAG TPA: hypothetical protein VJM79_01330 [Rhizorhapis sp.]|nr:hypothetical protein [Rhizorhapis sp.]
MAFDSSRGCALNDKQSVFAFTLFYAASVTEFRNRNMACRFSPHTVLAAAGCFPGARSGVAQSARNFRGQKKSFVAGEDQRLFLAHRRRLMSHSCAIHPNFAILQTPEILRRGE